MNSLLFFTQSDYLSEKTLEYARVFGKRMAEIAIDLARKRVDMFEKTTYSLRYLQSSGDASTSIPTAPYAGKMIDEALRQLDEAERSLRRRDYSQAYLAAERATREIRNVERAIWTKMTEAEIAKPVTPLSTNFYDAPFYLELYGKLASGKMRPTGPNLLRGGDMENPNSAREDGWQFIQERSANLSGEIRYDARARRTGERGLYVRVFPTTEGKAPLETECPVVRVEVNVPTQPGQIICVQGWIKIPNDLTNSVDGIQIYDDQGGQSLALRFKKSRDWTRFAFYRFVPNNAAIRVRFSFSGCGEAYLDDVAAYVVE